MYTILAPELPCQPFASGTIMTHKASKDGISVKMFTSSPVTMKLNRKTGEVEAQHVRGCLAAMSVRILLILPIKKFLKWI
jgi:hypothetical protein